MVKLPEIMERPELTDKFPAIDGIARGRKTAVRPDVGGILQLSDEDYENWFAPRYKAVNEMLEKFKLIGSVPNLSLGEIEHEGDETIASYSEFFVIIEDLEEARTYLLTIDKIRKEEISRRDG